MRNYVSCHCHQASLDTASTVDAFAKRELELETGYLVTTDHGTLQAAWQVYDTAKKKKLTPIIGLEAYLRDDDCPILLGMGIQKQHPTNKKGEPLLGQPRSLAHYLKYMHLTMHFLDEEAYETGVRLLSRASLNRVEKHGQEKKPLFSWADIEELGGKNVTMTSSCLVGVVQNHLLQHNNVEAAVKYFEKLKGICKPGNFYVEVFPHRCDKFWQSIGVITYADGTQEELPAWKKLKLGRGEGKLEEFARHWRPGRQDPLVAVMEDRKWADREPKGVTKVEVREGFVQNECRPWAQDGDVQRGTNMAILGLAQKYDVPVLIGDDSHYAHADEKIVQDIRLQASGGSWRFYGEYHRQTSEEARQHFRDTLGVSDREFESWVDNSHVWAARFKDFKFRDRKSLPTSFYPTDTLTHIMELVKKHGRMRWDNPVWVERLGKEIELLHFNGEIDLLPYFMVDEEVCDLYGQHGKLTGPGRGSAAGLLLCYLLRITHVDPIEYGLSMERFLTKSRIKSGKLPDIDQDLGDRDLLVDPENGWLKKRFGDCYAAISTDVSLKLRSAVKDVNRVLNGGYVLPEVEVLTKRFQNAPQGISDKDFVFGYKGSDGWVEGSLRSDKALQDYVAAFPQEWEIVQKCLGLTRQKSKHACFPATELVYVKGRGLTPIVECDGKEVYTGQGEKSKKGKFADHGLATLLDQGAREVFEYQLEGGRVIRSTPDHLVLTAEGWKPIHDAFTKGIELTRSIVRWKSTKEDAERYAQRRGGALVEWGGTATRKSTFSCDKGHTWKASSGQIISYEHWCRKCSNVFRRIDSKSSSPIERRAAKQLDTYRRYDKKRGMQFDLEVEDVIRAKQSPCIYCSRVATGMDRIDNGLGHTKANCAPACLRCNWMRGRYISHETMLQVGVLLKAIDP